MPTIRGKAVHKREDDWRPTSSIDSTTDGGGGGQGFWPYCWKIFHYFPEVRLVDS